MYDEENFKTNPMKPVTKQTKIVFTNFLALKKTCNFVKSVFLFQCKIFALKVARFLHQIKEENLADRMQKIAFNLVQAYSFSR
jgi:hypothetical protein